MLLKIVEISLITCLIFDINLKSELKVILGA